MSRNNPPNRDSPRRATEWASKLSRRERELFIKTLEPIVRETQAKLAACRRLNDKKEPADVPES